MCVCVCVSLRVIRSNNDTLRLQWVGRKGQYKERKKNGITHDQLVVPSLTEERSPRPSDRKPTPSQNLRSVVILLLQNTLFVPSTQLIVLVSTAQLKYSVNLWDTTGCLGQEKSYFMKQFPLIKSKGKGKRSSRNKPRWTKGFRVG